MTLSLEGLRVALSYGNVVAFLHAIEEGEIPEKVRHTPDAYRVLFGGELIDDLTRHPNRVVEINGLRSSAAGRFQALFRTWTDFCRDMGASPDEMPFDGDHQDLFGVWCLRRRGALQDVIAGRFAVAVNKCSNEWASFPGSPYKQPRVSLSQLRSTYLQFGGRLDNSELLGDEQPAAPIEDRPQPPPIVAVPEPEPEPKENFMAPIFAALLPTITSMIPQLLQIFGGDAESKSAKRNVAAASVVANTLIKATESVNLEQAVNRMQTDPQIAAKAKAAVAQEPTISALLEEVGGGIVETRKTWSDPAGLPFWKQGPFYIALLLLIVASSVVASVIWGGTIWRPEDRSQVLMLAVSLFSMVGGFWLGSSIGSVRKTDMINQARTSP